MSIPYTKIILFLLLSSFYRDATSGCPAHLPISAHLNISICNFYEPLKDQDFVSDLNNFIKGKNDQSTERLEEIRKKVIIKNTGIIIEALISSTTVTKGGETINAGTKGRFFLQTKNPSMCKKLNKVQKLRFSRTCPMVFFDVPKGITYKIISLE